MDGCATRERAIELLEQLGLREYEARCYLALSRLPKATATELSEVSDVPRTRVYDAVSELESRGLVEIQHASPQEFRAVPDEEALATLEQTYRDRIERLDETLGDIEAVTPDDHEATHEVWSLAGSEAIESRTARLIEAADDEIVLVVGTEQAVSPTLFELLDAAAEGDVGAVVGTATESLADRTRAAVPAADVFVSELPWLGGDDADAARISRLMLVDREAILVSSVAATDGGREEKAVFGRGFTNGMVVIARRLMATGQLAGELDGG